MPPDMPREDYAAPAMYTLNYLSRILRLLLYGAIAIGGASFATFEGLHMYIEHVCMATPSRTPAVEDPYGWQEENQGWTGGPKGGTDPRLGWKARHALRGAWICQEWGAGSAPTSISKDGLHPDMTARRGMIGGRVNPVDRGYELAEEYIDLAIAEAKRRGLVFPPNLSVTRPLGPPSEIKGVAGDPAATDLLMLKAGVLERMGTPTALSQARELYEQVLPATTGAGQASAATEARTMRLASKIGDLSSRLGDGAEAMEWWKWGLSRAGIDLPTPPVVLPKKGWFSSAKPTQAPPVSASGELPPPVLRATIAILTSTAARFATERQLAQAEQIQALALTLLSESKQDTSSLPAQLHETWTRHRSALLSLHRATVLHALGQAALEAATSASSEAELVLASLTPIPPSFATRGTPLAPPAKQLQKDAIALAAEAAYTRGLLLEKSKEASQLELAAECFERAMTLTSQEGKEESGGPGREEWARYWRGYARVRGKIDALLQAKT